MTVEEKYPLLIGHSLAGRTRLHNIQEVANFICTHGQYGDLVITERDGTPFLNTFGIYIDKISDMYASDVESCPEVDGAAYMPEVNKISMVSIWRKAIDEPQKLRV